MVNGMILACKEDQLVGSGDTDGAGNGLSFRGTELIICVVRCRPLCIIFLLFIVLSILRSTTSCCLIDVFRRYFLVGEQLKGTIFVPYPISPFQTVAM